MISWNGQCFPLLAIGAFCASLLIVPGLDAQPSSPEIEFFESKVRPVLVEHCYECHSVGADKVKGNLLLDSAQGWKTGGDSGPALVSGQPDDSLLIKAIGHADPDLQMPPKYRLEPDEIAALRQWVVTGAADPRVGDATLQLKARKKIDIEKGRTFWAFRPPVAVPLPEVTNSGWPQTDIDYFVLAKMEESHLKPGADADKRTLLRRAYFDLIGLPPTPAQIREFLDDPRDDTFAAVVDGLLARPEFGERWGRHWLDVARFAESSGGGRSLMFPHAWRFRDYVIDAFNADKPYDEFIKEHLAGDLLPWANESERNEHLVASGYLVLGAINYELQDKELLRMEVIDEQVSAMGRTFLGMTLDCARCHDHKFDPIPTADYYALAGIFGGTESLVPGNVSGYVTQKLKVDVPPHVAAYRQELAELKASLQDAVAEPALSDLKAEFKEKENQAPGYEDPVAMSVKDVDEPEDGHIHIRGGVRNKGSRVPRGVLTVALPEGQSGALPVNDGESGRRQLSEWIASADNPLTARVMVNRIWLHLIGQGIVRTPDNFGATGEMPSHPELLDYLAMKFVETGWSTKAMIREIMLSHVYQLSSSASTAAGDPENRLLTHAHRKRLQAEALRDSMLVLSGSLDPARGGRTIRKLSDYDLGYTFDTSRRSVYVPWFRNSMLDMFDVFDAPNPNLVIGRRTETNLPTQALFLMNSPFVREQAEQLSKHLQAEGITYAAAYEYVLGRPPSAAELAATRQFFNANADQQEAWNQFCQTLFACVDFRYLN
ncbi:MAG: PSD1 and planctomycete cytochrome C domain-containing protein [Verrucomicrobiales bacterium]